MYEINYDSISSYIEKVRQTSNEIGLDFPNHLSTRELRKLFLKDTVSIKELRTQRLNEIIKREIPDYDLLKRQVGEESGAFKFSTNAVSTHPTLNYIPVKFINYIDAQGNFPATEDQIIDAIGVANDNFRRNFVPIRFYLKCPIVYSNCVACGDDPKNKTLSAMYFLQTGLHFTVHLISSGGSSATYPWTILPGSIAIDVGDGDLGNGTTLTHEFGHSLGLYHTHRGRNFGQSIPSYGIFFNEIDNHDSKKCFQEPVSRTRKQGFFCVSTGGALKCEVNGDLLCDTPASPSLSGTFTGVDIRYDRTTCTYVWNGRDNWGALWTPPGRNYMGYTGICRNDFTAGQIGTMVNYLPSYSSKGAGYQINYSIPSGSSTICPSSVVTLSAPSPVNATEFAWHVPPGWTVASSGFTLIPEEEGWVIYRGGGMISLRAPTNISGSRIFRLGVNPIGCNLRPADIQLQVVGLQLSEETFQYCKNSEYSIYSNLKATYSLSNSNWKITSGQGTYSPRIKVGSGSCTISARYNCGSSGVQTATLRLRSSSCSGGGNIPIRAALVSTYYPNPSDGEVLIVLKEDGRNNVVIKDAFGEPIEELVREGKKFKVNLPKSPGLYLITIQNKLQKQIIKVFRK